MQVFTFLFPVAFFNLFSDSLQSDEQAAMVSVLNQYRAVVFPSAAKMTCVTWDVTIGKTVNDIVAKCKTHIGNNILFDVRHTKDDLLTLAGEWFVDGADNYDFTKDICQMTSNDNCNSYKILMNDQANSFACAQQDCPVGTQVCPSGHGPCHYTVCQFNVNMQRGRPYVKSDSEGVSCTTDTCKSASDPWKNECVNHLCCTGHTARMHEL